MGLFGLDLENTNLTLEEFKAPGSIANKQIDSSTANTQERVLEPISFNKLTISHK